MREIESTVRDVFDPIVGYTASAKKRKDEIHAFEIRRILAFIEIPESDEIARKWLAFAGKKNPEGLHKFAHRANLEIRQVDAGFARSWDAFQDILDAVLGQLEDRFFVFIDELDRLLAIEVPSETDVLRLQKYVVRNITTERYFFERLAHMGWLDPLREAGLFRYAPTGYWPVSDYVRRMASLAPALVMQCMSETPRNMSTWTVGNYLDAASSLEPEEAAAWARDWLIPWIQDQPRAGWLIPEKLQDFVLRLITDGQAEAGFAITASALSPLEAGTKLRFDVDDLETFVLATMPALTPVLPVESFALALTLFQSAVTIAGPERTEFDAIWRPSIAHDDYHGPELLNIATTLLRDTSLSVLTQEPARTDPLVEQLLVTNIPVARRLAWFLLSRFGARAPSHVRNLLLDKTLLRDSFGDGEYGLVLRTNVASLRPEELGIVLATLQEGPEVERFTESRRRWTGSAPSADDLREYVERWRYRFLSQIESALPEAYRLEYADLLSRFGPPETDDDDAPKSRWGAPTPKSTEELSALTTDEIVAFLYDWTPEGADESREGLGDALREAVTLDPSRFSAAARTFRVEEPIYVSDFLAGLAEAASKGATLSWPPVLDLCEFAVSHDGETGLLRLESTWGWSHQHVAWLLSRAIRLEVLPNWSADAVFRILEQLLSRAEPRPAEFSENSSVAAVQRALNSVHGVAVDSLISFAAWRKPLGDLAVTGKALALIRSACARRLNPAIHAAIGGRFSDLWLIDEEWLTALRPTLFPADAHLWSAAWAGYVLSNRAYPDVFDSLSAEYERAIRMLEPVDQVNPDEPGRRLAMHLGMLYLSGSLALSDPRFVSFFDRAPGSIRGTVHWMGLRAVDKNPDKVSDVHWARLRALWDARIAASIRSDSQKELHWFGWFFSMLPDSSEWALRALLRIVELGIDSGHDRDVMARLAALAPIHPASAFHCVRALAEADPDGHEIRGWGNEVEVVLVAARDFGDPNLKAEVTLFVNRLGSKGVLQFRHLVTS